VCFGIHGISSLSDWENLILMMSDFSYHRPGGQRAPSQAKKADVVEHAEVFDHVGLLVNKPPGKTGLPFI
jgi:hypothetical protein